MGPSHDLIFAEPADGKDGDSAVVLTQRPQGVSSSSFPQDLEVEDGGLERGRLRGHREGLFAVGNGNDRIAQPLKVVGENVPKKLLVVHEEEGTRTMVAQRCRVTRRGLIPTGGQQEVEGGPLAGFRLDSEGPVMAYDDGLAGGESKAVSGRLGGEERVKDPRKDLGGDSWTAIRNGQLDVSLGL